jgi:hypothetical protein
MIPLVPVDNIPGWPRKVANAINALIRGAVQRDGQDIYIASAISNPPTQAQVQAIADALEAVSNRLK